MRGTYRIRSVTMSNEFQGVLLGTGVCIPQTYDLAIVLTEELLPFGQILQMPTAASDAIVVSKSCDGQASAQFISPTNGQTVESPLDLRLRAQNLNGKQIALIVHDSGFLYAHNLPHSLGDDQYEFQNVLLGTGPCITQTYQLSLVLTDDLLPFGQIPALPVTAADRITVTKYCEASLEITDPPNGAQVATMIDVEFTALNLPQGATPVLVVESGGFYFGYPFASLVNPTTGLWRVLNVNLSSSAPCPRNFTLHVISTSETVLASGIPSLPAPIGPQDSVTVRTC